MPQIVVVSISICIQLLGASKTSKLGKQNYIHTRDQEKLLSLKVSNRKSNEKKFSAYKNIMNKSYKLFHIFKKFFFGSPLEENLNLLRLKRRIV